MTKKAKIKLINKSDGFYVYKTTSGEESIYNLISKVKKATRSTFAQWNIYTLNFNKDIYQDNDLDFMTVFFGDIDREFEQKCWTLNEARQTIKRWYL